MRLQSPDLTPPPARPLPQGEGSVTNRYLVKSNNFLYTPRLPAGEGGQGG